jgi:methylase of polypeptide subunit release factors
VIGQVDEINVHLDPAQLTPSDCKELLFWKDSPKENPESSLYETLKFKFDSLRRFERFLGKLEIQSGKVCLELGAGQGWAGALLKRTVPQAEIHISDVSVDALRSNRKWQAFRDKGRRQVGLQLSSDSICGFTV